MDKKAFPVIQERKSEAHETKRRKSRIAWRS